MFVIGINAFHGDSSACLVKDGILLSAVEEERFRRVKHWAGIPSKSILFCLEEAGISLDQVDVIAVNQDSRANIGKKLAFTLGNKPDLKYILEKVKTRRDREALDIQLGKLIPDQCFQGRMVAVEHHRAHLSSAFHVSPYQEAVVVSVDGFGDFASGAWGLGRDANIMINQRIYFPHSLGIFYQALTQFLGFLHYGDEYKVMGLAPYGQPTYLEAMRRIVGLRDDGGYELNVDYFKHHKENVVYEWENGAPVLGQMYSERLVELLGQVRVSSENLDQRHFDLARSVQAMYEEAFFHLLNTLHQKYGTDNLVLSGGCAMNSVANGKVCRDTPFENVYIQAAAGDAGGAIGAAFTAWHDLNPGAGRQFVMNHAYLGPAYSNEEISRVIDAIKSKLNDEQVNVRFVEDESELTGTTASAIAAGKVIGWFQGRMEWGPRALGNRSILCDPRRADMKDILNLKIKRRESFRPFAPSVLREAVSDWFEEDADVPFMMKVFQIKKERRREIPAVTHIDGSGRLQTVYEETNSRYYRLIKAFSEITSVPIVLNTSFNENEPIVCKPEEALACFIRTKMDVLVLGNWYLER